MFFSGGHRRGKIYDTYVLLHWLRWINCVALLLYFEHDCPMKIGIYARGLSGIGGVKQYIDAMCRALVEQIDSRHELFIFHNCPAEYFHFEQPFVHEVLLASRNRMVCDFVLAPQKINELNLDCVWFTKYVIPFGIGTRAIVTVHDMAYFIPELDAYTLQDTLYMRTLIRNSCRRADTVIAVSRNTRDDLVRILDIDPEKIVVVHEAADAKYRVIRDKPREQEFLRKYNIDFKYILFTGGISPRKNLRRLILAFDSLGDRFPHKLVLTGGKGWKNREIIEAIKGNSRIVQLGFVDDEDMPLLYNCADLFVYPSLYEGFGLPILEAQSCDCPVVCSRNSSLVEVGGDSVHAIDAQDVESICDGIAQVLGDQSTRKKLIRRGRKNVASYSWEKAAIDLLSIMTETA